MKRMLLDLLDRLPALRLVLASASPRRREILSAVVGPALEIIPSTFAEDLPKGSSALEYVQLTARKKAEEVAARAFSSEAGKPSPFILISTDTIVVKDDQILEKPGDAAHAFEMLSSLSGGKHSVISGVTVLTNLAQASTLLAAAPSKTSDGVALPSSLSAESFSFPHPPAATVIQFASETTVEFRSIPEAALRSYVRTKEPYDKAGGYGIQSLTGGAQFVKAIEGCYYNVMGLPLGDLCAVLRWILENSEKGEEKGASAAPMPPPLS